MRKLRLQLDSQEVPGLEFDPVQTIQGGSQHFPIGLSCHASESTDSQAPLLSVWIHQVGEMYVFNKQLGCSGMTTCVSQ